MATFSHSSLSTFENCPRRYKFRYLDKFDVGDRESIEAYTGSMVHEALRRLYELVSCGEVWSEEKLLEYLGQIWDRDRPGELFVQDPDLKEEHFRERGEKMLIDYYRMYRPFDQDKTVALERDVVVQLDAQGKYKLRGRIDRLSVTPEGLLRINDYKTSRYMVNQEALDEDRQLALYQLAVQQLWPDRKEFELVWHYLSIPERRTSKRSAESLEDLTSSAIASIRQINQAREDNNFPPKESALCNWCEYFHACPAKIHPLRVSALSPEERMTDEVIRTVDRFVDLKGHMNELAKEADLLRERLIVFAKQLNANVLAGTRKGVRVSFSPHYRLNYSSLESGTDKDQARRRLMEFLVRSGMIYELSINAQSLDGVVTRAAYNPDFKDELLDHVSLEEEAPTVTIARSAR
jgi:putative RecB family exonuclease